MPAREFYCRECHMWQERVSGETLNGSRRLHAETHTKDRELFDSDELLALDVEFERLYGGVF